MTFALIIGTVWVNKKAVMASFEEPNPKKAATLWDTFLTSLNSAMEGSRESVNDRVKSTFFESGVNVYNGANGRYRFRFRSEFGKLCPKV